MIIAKKLLAWVMGVALIPCTIILVWLATFCSFELLPVVRSIPIQGITVLTALIWGLCVMSLNERELTDFIS